MLRVYVLVLSTFQVEQGFGNFDEFNDIIHHVFRDRMKEFSSNYIISYAHHNRIQKYSTHTCIIQKHGCTFHFCVWERVCQVKVCGVISKVRFRHRKLHPIKYDLSTRPLQRVIELRLPRTNQNKKQRVQPHCQDRSTPKLKQPIRHIPHTN